MQLTFKNEKEWKAAVEAHHRSINLQLLADVESIAKKLNSIEIESSHLKDAKFFLDKVYTEVKSHNEVTRLYANKMKLESFKEQFIEDRDL